MPYLFFVVDGNGKNPKVLAVFLHCQKYIFIWAAETAFDYGLWIELKFYVIQGMFM